MKINLSYPIIIRSNKDINLYLSMNCEKVFTIYQDNTEKFNSISYNEVSDYYNIIEKGYNF